MSGINLTVDKLKQFDEVFNRLVNLLHKDEMQAFEYFLEFCIAGCSPTIKVDLSEVTEEIKDTLHSLYGEWITLMRRTVEDPEQWCDVFGFYYEQYSSKWKRKNRGQFFTPESICDLTAMITVDRTEKGKYVSDMCCGSGRLLLASNAVNPNNIYLAEDIDRICCLMTALNFFIHGMVGEVIWHNSLEPDSYYGGWLINANLREDGIISIVNLEKENSIIIRMWEERKREVEEQKKAQKPADVNNQLRLLFGDNT